MSGAGTRSLAAGSMRFIGRAMRGGTPAFPSRAAKKAVDSGCGCVILPRARWVRAAPRRGAATGTRKEEGEMNGRMMLWCAALLAVALFCG